MNFIFNNQRLIYRSKAPASPSGGGESNELDTDLLDDVNSSQVSAQNKEWLKEYVMSGDSAKADIVRRFLSGEIRSERELVEQIYVIRSQESSIAAIKGIQRRISARIMNTLEDVEVYQDLVPYQRKQFDRSLGALKKLNSSDAHTDNNLKETVKKLLSPPRTNVSVPATPTTAATMVSTPMFAAISVDDAKALYGKSLDTSEYQAAFSRLKKALEAAPTVAPFVGTSDEAAVRETVKKILEEIERNKRDEFKLEQQFRRVVREIDRVVMDSLDKAKIMVHEEGIIDSASDSCGVSLVEGTVIKVLAPDPESVSPSTTPSDYTISEVKVQKQDALDDGGRKVGVRFGTIMVTVKDSAGVEYTMNIGRFKKWLDATEAFEVVNSVPELEEKILYSQYGIKLQKDMQISYMMRKREKDGSIKKVSTFVSITEIKNNRIYFSQPVQYAPGFENIDYAEMKSSLSLGEFLKWWRRCDVEEAMDVIQLQDRLNKWQKRENKIYNEKNPPITVAVDEELMYPDETKHVFRIKAISDKEITLDTDAALTFNEFYKWVERNHVMVKPTEAQNEKEKKRNDDNRTFAAAQNNDTEAILKEKMKLANVLKHNAEEYATDRKSMSLWKKVQKKWHATQVLSLVDVGNMYKEISEFVKRRHERKSKGRYSQVGERLPGILGVDFERQKEDAEHEEVGKYQHAMEHWGIDTLRHVLHSTTDKDVCKAAIVVLVGKGEMRFDDPAFWETINKLSFKYTNVGGSLHIPAPHQYGPRENYQDYLEPAIDFLWAKRQYIDWNNENKSKYNSNVSTFEAEFKELSADPKGNGGPAGELERLLKKHLTTTEYVNPHKYESIIEGAIKNGKMGAEEKMFYLIAGLTALNPKRHPSLPILSYERVGELNSKYLAQFPLMDFFTEETVVDPFLPRKADGSLGSRKQKMEDFQDYVDRYFRDEVYGVRKDDTGKNRWAPGPSFSRFMWEKMLPSESVRTRISKGLRSAENMDHDDAHMYIPPATYEEIKKLCGPSTGNKLYFTPEGYANGYPGFNQWVVTLANVIEEQTNDSDRSKTVDSLQSAVNSFLIFDLILTNSIFKDDKQYARLDRHHFKKSAVTDSSCTLELHQQQMRNLVMELAKAYGFGDQFAFLYATKIGSVSDPKEKQKHEEFKAKVEGLKDVITNMINEDGGKKAVHVIRKLQSNNPKSGTGLRGIQASARPSIKELNTQRANAMHELKHRIQHQGSGAHH